MEAGPSNVPGMYTFALSGDPSIRTVQNIDEFTPNPSLPPNHPGATGRRYYTIQRVNGNGANGKDDGVYGGHQHTLEESDRVKKSSVQRSILKDKKDKRARPVCFFLHLVDVGATTRLWNPRMVPSTSRSPTSFLHPSDI